MSGADIETQNMHTASQRADEANPNSGRREHGMKAKTQVRLRLALLAGFIATLISCSGRVPSAPPRPAPQKSNTELASPGPQMQPPDTRPLTAIRFENCEKPTVFSFNNGGEHPQGSILETLGGGVAVLDFDRDGWPDLCFAAGGEYVTDGSAHSLVGTPVSLFQNQKEPGGCWEAVGRQAGFDDRELFSLGVAAADFDNDGFTDVCVTGYGPIRLYQNQGDGTFRECASSCALRDSGFTASAAWCDVNADGALDLYVCHYVAWDLEKEIECRGRRKDPSEICGPKNFLAESDRLFLGVGDGTFQDGTTLFGLQPGGKGLGVVAADVDLDGDVDVYVANDTTANFLYLNDGRGRFEEAGALHGVAYDENGRPQGSMGVAIADYDNDGLPDLWTTNFEFEALALYRNMGHAQFHLVSRPVGVTAMHGTFVSWGTAFADLDCDGDLDILVANGHLPDYVPRDRLAQPPFLLVNDGRRFSWARSPADSYFSTDHTGRGLAVVDVNRDGRLDLVVSHLSEPATVLRNTTATEGTTLQISLVGRDSNRDALGANALLETSNGTFLRQMSGGGSYLSTSEALLCWGLAPETVLKKLTLTWPSGKVQTVDRLPDVGRNSSDVRLVIVESP